ncbi:MAG: pseudouridine synthase [Chitinophagaceae bacterium]|nr:pseudouridine synthase [Chitinophagaceae bacterium]
MSKKGFDKFINKEATGAKKKEAIRQEKKKIKAALREEGARMRATQTRQTHNYQVTSGKPKTESPSFEKEDKSNVKNQKSKVERVIAQGPDDKFGSSQSPRAGAKPKTLSLRSQDKTADRSLKTEGPANMPLNKFIAHAGFCGRREAAELVKQGVVTVNGDKVYEPGYKVNADDKIEVKGKPATSKKNLVYILLNKPKDYITTAKDPEGRKTVLDLLKGATPERIFAVGRLDRNTTGVLLLTNDGELAQKLTHPSFEIKKIYEVKLDKPLAKKDFDTILNGVTLEDGLIQADSVAYADSKDKAIIGIEIHSGKNRIVRRLFEHLGYDVRNLDRVMFANLTKKNVDRGKWRFLAEKEVRLLKYMNQSFLTKKKTTKENG